MATLKLRAIGNSVGVVLPKELLAELGVREGDTLSVVRTPEGITLSRSEPEFERDLTMAREIMRRRRAVLRELAK